MSNVIQFLGAMGRNRDLSPAAYAATVAALDVDKAQKQALLGRDRVVLNDLLGGRLKMMFAILAPDDEPLPQGEPLPSDQPLREDPEPEDVPKPD